MINKIIIIISALAAIFVWGFFSFYNPVKIINKPDIKFQADVSKNNITPKEIVTTSHQLPNNQDNEIKKINMFFFGDMMLDRHVGEKINKNGLDYIFKNLAGEENRFFKGVDLISANLEGAVTNNGKHYKPDNAYDFAFAPKLIENLKKYNFNFFNIASNHLADQGGNGIIETSRNLSNLGFYFSGCQDGVVDGCSATTTEIQNLKIGLAGFSLVYNSQNFNVKKAENIIAGLASTTDLVIVNIHWGIEYEHHFNKSQQAVAHKLIDAGADIIIGHHPHVVQGMEVYKNKPIFYSLGNFIFDQYFSADTQEELAVGVEWSEEPTQPSLSQREGKLIVTLLPMKSVGSQPDLMSATEKENFLEKFIGWSEVDEEVKKEIKEGRILLNNL